MGNNSAEEVKDLESGEEYDKQVHVPSDELSVGSGDPTIADSDTDDEGNSPPVWMPLVEEIDHNVEVIKEKIVSMKALEK